MYETRSVEYRSLSNKSNQDCNLGHLTLAYCTTAHKSQGSEADTVVVLIPQNALRNIHRPWAYTAVSRARSRVILCIQGNECALWTALLRAPLGRRTRLPFLLQE